jgi:outer membrane protein assembly factor BamB
MSRPLALLTLAVALAACNSAKRENIQPPRELAEFATTVQVDRLWSRDIGDVGAKPGLQMSVAHVDGRLYAANTDGDLITLDAASGDEISRIETGRNVSTTPGVGDGAIAVGTIDGELAVYDLDSGAERFTHQLSSEIITAPLIAEGRVFVRSHDGRVSAFDLAGGNRLWVEDNTVPPLSLRGNGALRYDRGHLVFGRDDGSVVALRADTGVAVWQQQVGLAEGSTDLERLSDADGDIALVDGYAYAVGFEGQAMAIDVGAGTSLWARDLSAVTGVGYGEHVYVSDATGHVMALDRSSGGTLWTQEGLEHRWPGTPAYAGGHVAVGDLEGYVHWLNPVDGAFAARERVSGDPIRSAPIAVGNVVYVMSTDGTLAAYRVGG